MHSSIFQISSNPIDEDEWADPVRYYDNSDDFADYIGDRYEGDEREENIGYFADLIKDVFTSCGRGAFAYKGKKAMMAFKKKWRDEIQRLSEELTAANLFKEQRLYRIHKVTEESHLRSSYRVDINGWASGVAFPIGELFEYANSQLKEGDKIYVGAVIDYHF